MYVVRFANNDETKKKAKLCIHLAHIGKRQIEKEKKKHIKTILMAVKIPLFKNQKKKKKNKIIIMCSRKLWFFSNKLRIKVKWSGGFYLFTFYDYGDDENDDEYNIFILSASSIWIMIKMDV